MQRLPATVCLFALLAGGAAASPALTSVPTNMRSGPGDKYRVVQAIPADAEIDVTTCTKFWCQGSWRNLAGYVKANAIEPLPPGPPPAAVYVEPAPVVVDPWWGPAWGWGVGPRFYGPGFPGRGWGRR